MVCITPEPNLTLENLAICFTGATWRSKSLEHIVGYCTMARERDPFLHRGRFNFGTRYGCSKSRSNPLHCVTLHFVLLCSVPLGFVHGYSYARVRTSIVVTGSIVTAQRFGSSACNEVLSHTICYWSFRVSWWGEDAFAAQKPFCREVGHGCWQ